MLKLTIKNEICCGRSRNSLYNLFENGILRKGSGYSSNATLLNELCQKLNDSFKGKFLGDRHETESIVIINDKRKEVGRMQKRSLITTGLIYEELLQVNRGRQNYEDERNKFFAQDDTGNIRYFNCEEYLTLLDILWYMQEQQVSAIEILREKPTDECKVFMSSRYQDVATAFLDKEIAKGIDHIVKLGNEFFSLIKEDDGTIKYAKHFYDFRDSPSVESWSAKRCWYDDDMELIKKYMMYRRNSLWCEKTEEYLSTPVDDVLSWEEYVANESKKVTQNPRWLTPRFIASEFGMARKLDDVSVDVAVGKWSHITHYKTVAKSEFKRNRDWTVNDINFYKSEVLKLRSQMLEGSFNE